VEPRAARREVGGHTVVRIRRMGALFRAEGVSSTASLSTEARVLDEAGLHFLQGNSRLSAARLGNKTVPKILEMSSVLFQVDENRHLPAFAVRDQVNPSHKPYFPTIDARSVVAADPKDQ